MRGSGRCAGLACVVAVVLAAGCAKDEDAGETPRAEHLSAAPAARLDTVREASAGADAAPTDTTPADTAGWTAGVVEKSRPSGPGGTLAEVRVARNAQFDRVVFQFAGEAIPGYHVEYVDRPVRQCASGEPVPLAGDGWLSVRFTPARAHDDEGRATVRERERAPGLPVLKELKLTCDFEAELTWVLGVASPNRYRVLELQDPSRLVVDVRHE